MWSLIDWEIRVLQLSILMKNSQFLFTLVVRGKSKTTKASCSCLLPRPGLRLKTGHFKFDFLWRTKWSPCESWDHDEPEPGFCRCCYYISWKPEKWVVDKNHCVKIPNLVRWRWSHLGELLGERIVDGIAIIGGVSGLAAQKQTFGAQENIEKVVLASYELLYEN